MTPSLAIVLRSYSLGEADGFYSVYTNTTGKTAIKAKGIQKITSKLAGHVGPFLLSDIVTVPGREIATLTAASIAEDYRPIARNPEAFWHGSGFLELVETMTGEEVRDDRVWELLLAFFHALGSGVVPAHAEIEAGLRLMSLLGWRLRLDACVHCRVAPMMPPRFLDVIHGGTICLSCERSVKHRIAVEAQTIAVLERIAQSPFPMLTSPHEFHELKTLLAAHVGAHTDRVFRAFLRH